MSNTLTVMDAVNSFKGELIFSFEYLCYGKASNEYFAVEDLADINEDEYFICDKMKFKGLVKELETNFGRSYSYQQYKFVFKQMTSESKAKPVFTQAMADADIHESKNSGSFVIIERDGWERVTVQFIKTGYTTVTTNQNVQKGQVKDKLRPSVCGVGFVGDGNYTPRVKGEVSKVYQVWVSMIERCYSHLQEINNPTYKGCTVCGDWHNFQAFAEWFNNNHIEGCHLDKDIKIKGNKMYSPFTCTFVTEQENIENAHAKTYSLISPNGCYVSVYNMAKHCKEYGLSKGHMSKVISGGRESHKGWSADKRTDKEKALDDLFNADEHVANDINWHENFLQLIIDGQISNVKWVGK